MPVLQELRAGTSLGDVCRTSALAPTTVSQWRQTVAKGDYKGALSAAAWGRSSGSPVTTTTAQDDRRVSVTPDDATCTT